MSGSRPPSTDTEPGDPQPGDELARQKSSLEDSANDERYWKANLKLVGWCLAIWFIVSYGCGILLADYLNQFRLFGFKLGFWFAQQGSIYVFLVLIFFYASRMNALDRRFGASRSDADEEPRS